MDDNMQELLAEANAILKSNSASASEVYELRKKFQSSLSTLMGVPSKTSWSNKKWFGLFKVSRYLDRAQGLAIRRGQAEGTINGLRGDRNCEHTPGEYMSSATDGTFLYKFADSTLEQFEVAMALAEEDGNLSKSAVFQKLKELEEDSIVRPETYQSPAKAKKGKGYHLLTQAMILDSVVTQHVGATVALQTIKSLDSSITQEHAKYFLIELEKYTATINKITSLLKKEIKNGN